MLRGSYLGMLTHCAFSCIWWANQCQLGPWRLERNQVRNSRHVYAVTAGFQHYL
uniref:Uncharacterized protein n=1 Tax=Zea mays TaxID=4577 RepID=B4FHW5_MAIZE|nr:unknown [Zea mays]